MGGEVMARVAPTRSKQKNGSLEIRFGKIKDNVHTNDENIRD